MAGVTTVTEFGRERLTIRTTVACNVGNTSARQGADVIAVRMALTVISAR